MDKPDLSTKLAMLLVAIAAGTLHSSEIFAQPKVVPSTSTPTVPARPSYTGEQAFDLAKEYRSMVGKLCTPLREALSDNEKEAYIQLHHRASAMRTLGEIRAADAVPILMSYFAKQVHGYGGENATALTHFPAAEAITKIGEPAIRPVLDKLKVECSELELRLIAQVLLGIDGIEVARARLYIEQRKLVEEKGSEALETPLGKQLLELYGRLNSPGYFDRSVSNPMLEWQRIQKEKREQLKAQP